MPIACFLSPANLGTSPPSPRDPRVGTWGLGTMPPAPGDCVWGSQEEEEEKKQGEALRLFKKSGDSTLGCGGGVELVFEESGDSTAEGDDFGDLDF
ncbi:hypothetical protein ACLB2K_026835 [Fragaria x ananassa]